MTPARIVPGDDPTWPPCPDCGAAGDQRCDDDCPRIAGQVGLTFDGTQRPVRWTPPREVRRG